MTGDCPTCRNPRYNGTRHCHRPTCPKRRGASAPGNRDRRRPPPDESATVLIGPWESGVEKIAVGEEGDALPMPTPKKRGR